MFVRGGTVLPEYPVMQYVDEKPIDSLKLRVYYSNDETNSYLYEDHGDTFAYEQHIYMEKKFVVKGGDAHLTITQDAEGLFSERYDTYDLAFIGLPFRATAVLVDGKKISASPREDGHYTATVPKDFRQIVVT